jgi:hypothetical protein
VTKHTPTTRDYSVYAPVPFISPPQNGHFSIVIGQNLTQRRKGAKKTEEKPVDIIPATGCQSSLSKNPLRLSAFA